MTAHLTHADAGTAPNGGVATRVDTYKEKRAQGQRALKELMAPIAPRLALGRFVAVCSSLVAVAPFIALVRIGDILLPAWRAGTPIDNEALSWNVKLLVGAFCTQLFLYFLALSITHFADLKLRGLLQERIIAQISRAPLSWFSRARSGQIRKAIQADTTTLHTLVAHAPVETTAAVATPLALVIFAFTVNWRLGLLTMIPLPFYFAAQMFMMRDMGEKTAEMDDRLGYLAARGVEFVEGIQVVKSFGKVGHAHRAFARAADDFGNFYWDWCGPMLKGSALAMSFISAPVVLLVNMGLGSLILAAGAATLPEVIACSLIGLIVPLTFDTLSTSMWSYQLAGNSALRIIEVTSVEQLPQLSESEAASAQPEATQPAAAPTAASAGEAAGGVVPAHVVFENVSYSYPRAGRTIQALDGVSLTLRRGTVTALLGPSGSGKSTLATMLARFRDPDSGRVLLEGHDLRTFSEKDLYKRVAFVLQDAHMLRMSVRDNIRLARPNADDAAIEQAARAANIWEDICALPRGLDTVLGEDTAMSGGQNQRLAIARALLADADLLILDEATVATDPQCEAEIQSALNRLVAGRTVLVIAHHAESVLGVDQVCILEQGRISALGTPDEVAAHPFWVRLMEGREDA
ncbi:ABC transporter ATP-binding protein [Actinotignum timonense]|uniref:ABC transporter ATP-binding protein n=1 Tax=Actinotignum timonense TaxID=1870995 RepID=A0AAW9HPS9_9ACTO|nr:ABC transporter ATP-binding protein [Actinotignum timonense]MDK6591147.1 ABC transporter ATP-binding protein [Actinotignum timonense]MDK6629606.1 ABC transporter ATP-binding protein [Actinotignum timonense]MDY5141432.1 ABC transporter ATP-binding protein [Actinotignum timonense]